MDAASGTARVARSLGALLLLLVAGCDATSSSPAGSSAPTSAAATTTTPDAALDPALLPLGPPPSVTHLAGGQLHWRGRTVPTDLPADALYPEILGTAGGRLVVTADQASGRGAGTRFWAVDRTGHARRLGRGYETRDYPPRLVESTGHLWLHDADRTTPRTLWELDARTGRELATYAGGRVPHGLAPADQAFVDALVRGRLPGGHLVDRTRDGSLEVTTGQGVDGTGSLTVRVVVRRTADDSRVGRFAFGLGTRQGSIDDVLLVGHDEVLALLTVLTTRRQGAQQVIVRCHLSADTCERATAVGGTMALGVQRPALPAVRAPG